MLNPSDVYVSGGSNDLLVCWTDKVTKYDASSFYNWEQDNLPLHDLDERTHLLWEKLGHPTSALTGMSFIVSADATDTCNPLVFTTLSACINALPEVINCPILVEVASFGNLGGLNLSNKAFGPNGALEITNRNSAFALPLTLSSTADHYTKAIYDSACYRLRACVGYYFGGTLHRHLSTVNNSITPFPGADHAYSYMFTKRDDGSTIRLASGVNASDWPFDTRFRNPYVFTKRVHDARGDRLTASLSSASDPWDLGGSNFSSTMKFIFDPYDKTNFDSTYDVSTQNFLTDSEIAWGSAETLAQP
jgi:hypothetical protein